MSNVLSSRLPCHPCPHESGCCTWGAPLTEREADAIREQIGPRFVAWDPEEKEWRTALVNGTCAFQQDNGCSIHARLEYPSVCAGFPFRPDESEVDICPELLTGKHPELDVLFDPVTKQLRVTR
jgi:Putative zinc- or iron-chelating domain